MIDEIETNFENSSAMRNWRSCEAARCYIKRDVPGMIRPRREREPNLADDLRPHVQCCACLLPFLEWQSRPNFSVRLASSHDLSIIDLVATRDV